MLRHGEPDRRGEAGTVRGSRRVRRRPDEGDRGAAPREVRDEERDRLQTTVGGRDWGFGIRRGFGIRTLISS